MFNPAEHGCSGLFLGDNLEVLRSWPDACVDSIVTDPPYGLSAARNSGKKSKGGFMGKAWDYDVPTVELWRECLRVLKPGGHMLAFGGTRTNHRLVVAIEDAGFEIRDMLVWIHAQGFPKSTSISKMIDKEAGATREVVASNPNWRPAKTHGGAGFDSTVGSGPAVMNVTAPATDAAREWNGWHSALKPANEPICLARKPLSEKTLAKNVLAHGTGALNVDGCRIGFQSDADEQESKNKNQHTKFGSGARVGQVYGEFNKDRDDWNPSGRHPANLILDESMAAELDAQSGVLKSGKLARHHKVKGSGGESGFLGKSMARDGFEKDYGGDSGGASRFFFCAKASRSDRGPGNIHPTCKPTKLMAYLCRLITPPGGICLDPFMGSGSTGVSAQREGFRFAGIEREHEYFDIAKRRIHGEDWNQDEPESA